MTVSILFPNMKRNICHGIRVEAVSSWDYCSILDKKVGGKCLVVVKELRWILWDISEKKLIVACSDYFGGV